MKALVQAAAFCPVDPMMATFAFILVVALFRVLNTRVQKPARRVKEQIKQCGDSLMSGGFGRVHAVEDGERSNQ
jgi:hypothetical protein